MPNPHLNRRGFLKVLGSVVAAGTSPEIFGERVPLVAIVADLHDPVASSAAVSRAIEQLANALKVPALRREKLEQADAVRIRILAAGSGSPAAKSVLGAARVQLAQAAEAVGLVGFGQKSNRTILACGHDVRGLVYALTELTDRVRSVPDAMETLAAIETTIEQPANRVRSMMRLFTSEVEDKPWYNDRAMWPEYFDMLAAERFNRFNLAFGIGYDFIRNVTDAYFLFTYPFLLDVPGYKVRVPQLPNQERDRNLEVLRYIGEQCVARGLEFHVGLWMHGYEWIDSPNANYTIEGLNKNNHGTYCRDALRMLLKQVPNISGITFRIHGESGVAEGSFDFWKTVFDGVATCGRRVEIDMHAKGMSQPMIDLALAAKQPVTISPKFWGEHMGMPYHQADIRRVEKPKQENATGLLALSSGTRSFLRYSYGDLLREDRQWKVVHRIWPGTQRLLLWGDPEFASAYSRAFSFCGSDGVEIMEPLSFKGRRGSGHAGSRCGYADAVLDPKWDWQKYEYSTRVWGRMLFNPQTSEEVLSRPFLQFSDAGTSLRTALAKVSRILPIVTTAYAPSAANNVYWPEMYANESMVDATANSVYFDSDQPRVFGNASPFDPELFLSANQCAAELLEGKPSGKYTPLDVAEWMEGFAAEGRSTLAKADASISNSHKPGYRRAHVDIEIQAASGEFFAAKLRSAVLFHLYEINSEPAALKAAIEQYRKARAAFLAAAEAAKSVYANDVAFGEQAWLRGHWHDRLPAIDKDIAALSAKLDPDTRLDASPKIAEAIRTVLGKPQRFEPRVRHEAPSHFKRGEVLWLAMQAPEEVSEVKLHYRRVNQAENFVDAEMERQTSAFRAAIPPDYTRTEFPLEYYFEVRKSSGSAGLYPGLSPELTSQPYFVVLGS